MPAPGDTLPGRETPMPVVERHFVLGTPIVPPFPRRTERAIFGMGCFWGAERLFWKLPGVYTTAVGYAGGTTPEPDLRGGLQRPHRPHRGRPRRLRPQAHLVRRAAEDVFWESHDPTQGMRQGNDVGTQYRSADLLDHRGAAGRGARVARPLPAGAEPGASRRDHHRDRAGPDRSTTPRTTTSSTSPRTRTATAGSAAPASPARSDRRGGLRVPAPADERLLVLPEHQRGDVRADGH